MFLYPNFKNYFSTGGHKLARLFKIGNSQQHFDSQLEKEIVCMFRAEFQNLLY